ncbi:MAG: ROK family protein [Acidobacteria bacterium]|nr:ROK family protein [Acidobacteriota bacterium]
MGDYSIGVDLGGTNLRAAAIDPDGQIIEKSSCETNPGAGRDALLDEIVEFIRTLTRKMGTGRLIGVGIGIPGFIDMKRGFIVGSHNLPFFNNFPVRDEIQRRLGAPVLLENDANAAALGEKWIGAGRDVDDLVLLTLGTGIGGGIISGGRILHGSLGMAGEIGHVTINPTGNPCACGSIGCLEKHASATAVEAMAHGLHLGPNATSEDVYHLAVAGDAKARMVWETVGRSLGIALATLINIFNFPLYLLSGGMLPAWEFFSGPMEAEIRLRSFTYRNSQTTVGKATLGSMAGLYGAAYLPFQAAAGIQ